MQGLILAHQSFDQLIRGDIDLSGLIWQARSRLMFANDADDADRIAHELATLTYDPMKLKEILYTRRQRIAGHQRNGWNMSPTLGTVRGATATSAQEHVPHFDESPTASWRSPQPRRSRVPGDADNHAEGTVESAGRNETLVPIHEDFVEVSRQDLLSFEEQRPVGAKGPPDAAPARLSASSATMRPSTISSSITIRSPTRPDSAKASRS